MQCPECESQDSTHIVINLAEQDAVHYYSCRSCEARWWEHDGDAINLDQVLDLAARA